MRRPRILQATAVLSVLMVAVIGFVTGIKNHRTPEFARQTVELCPPQSNATCLLANSSREDGNLVTIIDFITCDSNDLCFFDIAPWSHHIIAVDLYNLPLADQIGIFRIASYPNKSRVQIMGTYDHLSHMLMAKHLIYASSSACD